MGSISAMSSLERVLQDHQDDVKHHFLDDLSEEARKAVVDVEVGVEDNCYALEATWVVSVPGSNAILKLPGPKWDIEQVAEAFPCCEVGW